MSLPHIDRANARLYARRLTALLAILPASVAIAGCGDSVQSSAESAGCLTPDQVQEQVDQIAAGVEGSQEEVEQKQAAISEIRSREC